MSKPTTFRFSFGPAPRAPLWGVLAALLAAMPVAFADPYDGQAEWAQRYDAAERLTVSRSTTPILSTQTVAATEEAIRQYQEIVANGRDDLIITQRAETAETRPATPRLPPAAE